MPIRIEIAPNLKVPKNTELIIDKVIKTLPAEHLHGIERIKLVDKIQVFDPRLKSVIKPDLPGFYYPRQGNQKAWIEIAVGVLIPQQQSILKRFIPKLSFKANLTAILISLVGQHYHLTLKHSLKKGQIEASVRAYTERYLKVWNENEHSLRMRLFKPLQPTLEKWGRRIQKRVAAEKKKSKTA
jgi:hypothetical protein